MQYVGIPLAMAVMFLAQSVEARFGVAAAGWFAALPVSFAVGTASIAVTHGHTDASQVALSAIGHVGPMIVYGVIFVNIAPRWGVLRAFLVGAVGYAVASAVIAPFGPVVQILLSVIALVLGNIYQSRRSTAPVPSQAATRLQRGLSLASAGLVVALLTVTNQYFGPTLAGALGAFPVMSTTIAFANAPREGAANASTVMAGVARSLPIYLTYGLALAAALAFTSTLWAVTIAVTCSMLVAAVTRKRPARTELTEDDLITAEP